MAGDRSRLDACLTDALLSTEEIAREMYLSVNTIKTHFKNIFRKLGATAVAKRSAGPGNWDWSDFGSRR